MRLKDLITSKKEIAEFGLWKTGVKMPKSAFPIDKGKLTVRGTYRWKVIKFNSLGEKYRVLIFYRIDKEVYYALLGMEVGGLMSILAKYEYHASHAGWHIHTECDTSDVDPGRIGISDSAKRIPRGHAHHRKTEFGITGDEDAQNKAIAAFGLDRIGGGLFER